VVREKMSERVSNSAAGRAPFVGADFADEDFQEVVRILQSRRAFDLGSYKDRCIKRRIASRVRAKGLNSSAHYVELLDTDNDEVDALLAVLTIHVSHFFRNPSTYQILEEKVLPDLFETLRQSGQKTLRVWSVGCSSGEEPYSMALLLHEMRPEDIEISILGTDISAPILERAEIGEYDAQRLAEVPDEVRDRYFERLESTRFRLKDEIRSLVEFSQHDVLKESDYPPADLILCRNVMIYFSREEQSKILERFARSLGPDRFLVLGRAETLVGSVRHIFRSEYPIERIYRCIEQLPEMETA
jgi:chemotaxis protein methyltransferase CheR